MEKRKSRSNWGRRTVTPALAILRPEGTVAYIGGSDTLPAPLTREEEQALFLSMDEQPETARQTLIEHNLRLVVYIARKFENTGVGIEDLISIGTIGLIKAVKTFDYTKKIKLATYFPLHRKRNRCFCDASRQAKVSLDEPSTRTDGNDVAGHSRYGRRSGLPLHRRDVDGRCSPARCPSCPSGKRRPACAFRWAVARRSRNRLRYHGHQPELYFAAGKEDSLAAAKGYDADGMRKSQHQKQAFL
ncbi:MAG: sigma factor [Christensenellales bacterium]